MATTFVRSHHPPTRTAVGLSLLLAGTFPSGLQGQAPLRVGEPPLAKAAVLAPMAPAPGIPLSVRTSGAHSLVFAAGEHADGGEIPVLILAGGLAASIVADIVATPGSVRTYNEENPQASPKSAQNAIWLALAATTLPAITGLRGDSFLPVVSAGLVFGPAAGHFYAGQHRKAWIGAGLRSLLLVSGLIVWGCCT